MSSKKPYTGSYKSKRKASVSRLSLSLDKITNPSFKKRGFAEYRIITDWSYIVGDTIARFSNPLKLVFPANSKQGGTLHIEVYDSAFATEIHYLGSVMKERIATYFGYTAVGSFRLIQRSFPFEDELEVNRKAVVLSQSEQQEIKIQLDDIQDEPMQKALGSLGKNRLLRQKAIEE